MHLKESSADDFIFHLVHFFIHLLIMCRVCTRFDILLPEQALHEALMRQEELLAYIDSQEEAKFRVS